MPYQSNKELPDSVLGAVPSEDGRSLMREVINSQLADGESEAVAFASAWAALQNAGYEQSEDDQWTKKLTPSDVHVPSTNWRDRRKADSVAVGDRVSWSSSGGTARGIVRQVVRDGNVPGIDGDVTVTGSAEEPAAQIEIVDDEGEPTGTIVGHKVSTLRKADNYTPPESARNNAKRVLRWREEHGDEVKGMTQVGWTRANQLASGEALSRETVGRIAAFRRHQGNADVAPEYKGEPWKDAGHVAWLGWGGESGVSWAEGIVAREKRKRQLRDDQFTTVYEAQARALDLGFKDGATHVHEDANGQAVYMPGPSHEAYIRAAAQVASAGVAPAESSGYSSGVNGTEALGGVTEGSRILDGLARVLSMLVRPLEKSEAAPAHEQSSAEPTDFEMRGTVLKLDEDQRIVWGWASVITKDGTPVVDLQGDIIFPDELVNATTDYMLESRVGKTMHVGEQTSVTVHSFPMTYELAKALGIDTPDEGWIVAQKITDDATWERYKSGELKAFSIGGSAVSEEVEIDE